MTKQKSKNNISVFSRIKPINEKPSKKIKLIIDDNWKKFNSDYDELFGEKPKKKIKPIIDDKWDDDEPMFDNKPSKLASKKALTIEYTRLIGFNDPDPKRCSIIWDGFCEKYDEPVRWGKLKLREHHKSLESRDRTRQQLSASNGLNYSIIPGIFNRPKTTQAQYLRARHLLVLEIDDGVLTFKSLSKKLKRMKLKCVVHSSFLDSKSKNMFLVYIPFNKALTVDIEGTCSRALDWFKSILGDHINPRCWKVNQNYYYKPVCPPDAVALYEATHMEGKPLIIDNFRVNKDDPKMIQVGCKPAYDKVVEDFNCRADWREILLPQGFAYYFTGSSGKEYYKGVKKHKNAIIGTVDLEHNVFYAEKRAKIDCSLFYGRAYSPFEAYEKINYPRDKAAAIRSLKLKGYGKPKDFSKAVDACDLTANQKAGKMFPTANFPLVKGEGKNGKLRDKRVHKKVNSQLPEKLSPGSKKRGTLLNLTDLKVKKGTNIMSVIYWKDEIVHEHVPKQRRAYTLKQKEIFGDY